MQYRNALKFSAKSQAEVSTFIADASNLLGTSKNESEAKLEAASKVAGSKEKAIAFAEAFGIDLKGSDKEATRAVRAAYLFARASLIGALESKFSAISDNDSRSNDDLLKLAREMRQTMGDLKIDNTK